MPQFVSNPTIIEDPNRAGNYLSPKEIQRKGIRIYLSERTIREIFEKFVKKQIEKSYQTGSTSGEEKSIATMTFGLRETAIKVNLKLDHYDIELNHNRNCLVMKFFNQSLQGDITLHVEKAAKLFDWINFGDIINKDYYINFELILSQVVVHIWVIPEAYDIAHFQIHITLENLNLEEQLHYYVLNSDFLTDSLDTFKSLWLSLIEDEIRNNVMKQVSKEITVIVNSIIKEVFKPQYKIPIKEIGGEKVQSDVNIQVDLNIEEFQIKNNFAVTTINGFCINPDKRKQPYFIAPQGYSLPDMSRVSGEDKIVLQISDEVLHSAIMAFLSNDFEHSIPFEDGGCKSITIGHLPEWPSEVAVDREESETGGFNLRIIVSTRITAQLSHKFLPSLKVGLAVKVKLLLNSHKIDIKQVIIEELFDHKMQVLSINMRKQPFVGKIQKYFEDKQMKIDIPLKYRLAAKRYLEGEDIKEIVDSLENEDDPAHQRYSEEQAISLVSYEDFIAIVI